MANIIIMPFNALSDHLCFMGGKHCHHGRYCSQWRCSASWGNLSNHSESFLIVEQSRDWPMWLWRDSIIITIIMNQQHRCVFVFFAPHILGVILFFQRDKPCARFVLQWRRVKSVFACCGVKPSAAQVEPAAILCMSSHMVGILVWELKGAFHP